MNANRRRAALAACFATIAAIAGCFYISIKFPETEIEELARRIAREYYQAAEPGAPGTTVPAEPVEPPPSEQPPKTSFLSTLFESPVYAAEPAPQERPININATSPAIKKIQQAQRERLDKLRPLYERGLVGILNTGNLAVREVEGVSLKEKTDARRLVDAENADRAALYRELAVANDIPASEVPRIQAIFAKKWIEEAPVGYWYQDEKGNWLQVKPKR